MGLLDRLRSSRTEATSSEPKPEIVAPALVYSWVISGRLAVGPLPRTVAHWQQLENAGFRSRFSCCYPEEERITPPPHWIESRVSLPDHRRQEPLRPERLAEALDKAETIMAASAPTYLHCMAGIERSPLIAAGLVARQRGIDLLAALEVIRLCHPRAMPIYSDLDVLDAVLREPKPAADSAA